MIETDMINLIRQASRRVARAILLTVAVLYFLIDLIFLSVVRPMRRRIMALGWMRISREWVGKLDRYAALLLLLMPWLILEPIKPIGFLPFCPQAPSRCHTADNRRRGREADFVRAAIRHDQAEADDLPLVCMVLQQMAGCH